MCPICDRNGVPIFKGDLIRTPHFVDRRRKQHYLYHVVVECDGHLKGVPTSHLEPTLANGGGSFWLHAHPRVLEDAEVIHGYGPGDTLSFEDRPKIKREAPNATNHP